MRSRDPKVLFLLGGLPLLAHPLRALALAGADRAVVVTGHQAERVETVTRKELGETFPVSFARQDPPRGTGDAVACALRAIEEKDGTLLIVNGDLPLLEAKTLALFLEAHRKTNAAMTFLSLVREDPAGYGRLRVAGDRVLEVIEDADADAEAKKITTVNGGLYAVELAALRPALDEWCRSEDARIARGDPGPSEIYFPPIIGPIAAAGGSVRHHELAAADVDQLQQVNDRRELSVAGNRLRARLVEEHQLAGVTVVDPEQTWIECDVVIGSDTLIHPGTIIRRGVVVGEQCEIGPHAHLREGTVLADDVKIGNYVEVKKTRIGRGTRAKHLTYLGNGVIGERVNIGAGTVLANYDGVRKSTTEIGDDVFIGSGTIIIAPARIGAGAKTGAGAVVKRGSDIPPGETVVGVPARSLANRALPPSPGNPATS